MQLVFHIIVRGYLISSYLINKKFYFTYVKCKINKQTQIIYFNKLFIRIVLACFLILDIIISALISW